jgi:hypothetical protein
MSSIEYVYSLADPRNNQVRYIGKSINPFKRFVEHKSEKYKNHKCNWVQSLKKLNLIPILEIIECCKAEEVEFWENYYIGLYKSWGFNLVNDIIPGKITKNYSQKTKNKISSSNIGKKSGLESYKAQPILQRDYSNKEILGVFHSINQASLLTKVSKQSIYNSYVSGKIAGGYIWEKITKEEYKQLIKNNYSVKTKQLTPKINCSTEHKKSLSASSRNRFKKEFIGWNYKTGEYAGKWDIKKDCGRDLGVNASSVVACLKGKLLTTGDYKFFYV